MRRLAAVLLALVVPVAAGTPAARPASVEADVPRVLLRPDAPFDAAMRICALADATSWGKALVVGGRVTPETWGPLALAGPGCVTLPLRVEPGGEALLLRGVVTLGGEAHEVVGTTRMPAGPEAYADAAAIVLALAALVSLAAAALLSWRRAA